MPFPTFTAGEAPDEATWDAWVGAQVIGQYADAATRDTEIGDEIVNGMRAVTLDDGIEWIAVLDPLATIPYVATDFEWMEYGRYKEWGLYTPTVTATTTNPTLGTGHTALGKYHREGTLATVMLYIQFGATSAAGSGVYEISLPTECPAQADWYGAQEVTVGNGMCRNNTTGERKAVGITIVNAAAIRMEAATLTTYVTDANLIAWADNDILLSGVINYETAEAF